MKDVTGRLLVVGDKVAFLTPSYRELSTGVVGKLNPTGATILHGKDSKTPRASRQLCIISHKDTELLDLIQKIADADSLERGSPKLDVRDYLLEVTSKHLKEIINGDS